MKVIDKILFLFFYSLLAAMVTACGGSSKNGGIVDIPTVVLNGSNGGIANNETNVSMTPIISLQFSTSMQNGSINAQTVVITTDAPNTNGNLTSVNIPIGQILANSTNTTFTFSPASALAPNQKYYIIVTDAKSINGKTVSMAFNFTTGSAVVPMVAIVAPQNVSMNTSLVPIIQLAFSTPVKNIASPIIAMRKGSASGELVDIGQIYAGGNNTYTFSPSQPLAANTSYVVIIGNGVQDMNGNALAQTEVFSFTTGTSSAATPDVTMINPTNNSVDVALDPHLQFQFNESVLNVNPSTVMLYESSVSGSASALELTAVSNNNFTFSTINSLKSNTLYVVVLSSQITDSSGTIALPQTTFSFTTSDLSNPVVSVTPTNNTNYVSINKPSISLQFSKPVRNVTTSTVYLESYGSVVQIQGSVSGSESSWVFTPNSALLPKTTYYVILESAITDTTPEQNILSYSTPSRFTTSSYTFTPVTSGVITGGESFLLTYNYNNSTQPLYESAQMSVTLPDGFTVRSSGSSTYDCIFDNIFGNECSKIIDVASGTESGTYFATLTETYAGAISSESTPLSVVAISKKAYIVNSVGSPQIEVCDFGVNGLSNCANGIDTPIPSNVYGITISPNGKYAYVSVNAPQVLYVCNITAGTGVLSNCVSQLVSTSFGTNRDTVITSDGKYLYADSMSPNAVFGCQLNSDGTFGACTEFTTSPLSVSGVIERLIITPDNSKLLINSGSGVIECALGSDYLVTGCATMTASLGPDPLGINFNLDYSSIFVTATNVGTIAQCPYNKTTGAINACTSAWLNGVSPTGNIRFTDIMFTPYNYALLTNVQVNVAGQNVYKCLFDVNTGLLDASTCQLQPTYSLNPEQITVF